MEAYIRGIIQRFFTTVVVIPISFNTTDDIRNYVDMGLKKYEEQDNVIKDIRGDNCIELYIISNLPMMYAYK